MNDFKGKVAVVTGAGSGIGRALAQGLAAAGARLALSDLRSEGGLQETMELLPKRTEARSYTVDVSSREAVFAHAEEVNRDFGAVHFLFNNAGITIIGTVEHTSIEEYEKLLGINMWGVLYGTKAFLPIMLKQKEGCIINISSMFGFISAPNQSAYNMSKFAVRGLTECLWQELKGTGVRAVSVHPGGIRTNIAKTASLVKLAGKYERLTQSSADRVLTTPPQQCATDILTGIRNGKRRILTGNGATAIFQMVRLFPNKYSSIMHWVTTKVARER